MKKLILFLAIVLTSLGAVNQAKAQNVQMHYDFGHFIKGEEMRPSLTTTVEMFRPDKWGDTFFFVDMRYAKTGVQEAYWEVARNLKFWQAPVSIHLEYNGGLSNEFSFNNAFLLGASYAYNAKDYTYGFSITPSYKYIAKEKYNHSFQTTFVWYWNFAEGLLSFSGFMDLWTETIPAPIPDQTLALASKGKFGRMKKTFATFLTQPQFWVNLNRIQGFSDDFNLSVGTELEMSYNFPFNNNKFRALPTLAVKWTF